MALNNPRSTERDNQNALRKYPFSDASACENGACVIVPGAIIDAQLYIPGRPSGPVWMSLIDTDGRIHFSDDAGEFAETSSAATANTAVPVVFTGDGGPLPGGVVVFGRDADVSVLRSAGGQSFTQNQAELTPAAVTFVGLPGVHGFKLDDGNVVYGAVKIRGENGCDVATYVKDHVGYIRISAIGKAAETVTTTGYITKVAANSDNTNFTVSNDSLADHVIHISATGVSTMQDNYVNADQDNTCVSVRKARGTVPSSSATVPPDCGAGICNPPTATHTITFMNGTSQVGSPMTIMEGAELGTLTSDHLPESPKDGMRFAGYYDIQKSVVTPLNKRLYYTYAGVGMGRFTATSDVTLYAYWISSTSEAEATFQHYGTLHLDAPDTDDGYTNPIHISGNPNPIPVIREVPDDTLVSGGAEALSELVLHPTVPSGEVIISIRGLDKAYSS